VQLTSLLVETIKSGKITVCQNNVESLEIKAGEKKIDVNAIDKKIVKEIISNIRDGNSKSGSKRGVGVITVFRDVRPLLKEIVDDLFEEGVTITISYKGDKVATIGSEANSKLTRFITGTRHVEINSLAKLIKMNI
jgi:hypothetical protein